MVPVKNLGGVSLSEVTHSSSLSIIEMDHAQAFKTYKAINL